MMKKQLPFLLAAAVLILVGLWLVSRSAPSEQPPRDDAAAPGGESRNATRRAWAALATAGGDDIPFVAVLGRVTDAKTGRPIARAMVCVSGRPHEPWEHGDREPSCVPTEADGAYAARDLRPGVYWVEASADGYQPGMYRHDPDSGRLDLDPSEERSGVDVALDPGGVLATGAVLDIGGGPVAGARVAVSPWRSSGANAHTTSDAEGRFSATVEAGNVWIQAKADGYAEGTSEGVAPGQTIEVLLTPESGLQGRVVRVADAAPISGARIFIDESAGWYARRSTREPRAVTDATGRFRVAPLEPGRYKPRATAPAGYGEAAESVVLGIGETSPEILIRLHSAFIVEGRVVTDDASTPCERGEVTLVSRATEARTWRVIERDGCVRFDALLPDVYRVTVECKGHAAPPDIPDLEITDHDLTDLVWQVVPGNTIRGRVVDAASAPVANVRLWVSPRSSQRQPHYEWGHDTTDENGRFEIEGMRPGDYWLATHGADIVDPDPMELTVEAGRDRDGVVVRVDRGGRIEGTVEEVRGTPVAGAHVYAEGKKRDWFTEAFTSDDGHFVIPGVEQGDYRVHAASGRRDPLPAPGKNDDDPPGERVEVKAGETAHVDLVVENRDGVIRGTVVTADGAPVQDGFIDALREPKAAGANPAWTKRRLRWGWQREPALTEQDGSFVLDELSPGTYAVRAFRKGGGEAIVDGVALGSTTTLTIAESGSVSGRVTANEGPPARFEISVLDKENGFERAESFFQTNGAWTMTGLPDGTYKLRAEAVEGTAEGTATVDNGDHVADVMLKLVSRAVVRGRFFDVETNAPVAGVMAMVQPDDGGALRIVIDGDVDEKRVSDAQGKFEVTGALVGKARVIGVSLDFEGDPYGFAVVPATTRVGETLDVEIPLARRRMRVRERGGDLGFDLKQRDPNAALEENTLDVALVRPEGPAAGCGLQVGDRIVSIDGVDVRGWRGYLYRGLGQVPPGTTIRLGLARGTEVAITAGAPR